MVKPGRDNRRIGGWGPVKALFAVKDTLKLRASGMVQRLQRKGLKTFLVTGDTRLTAMAIAKEAGFSADNVMAEVRPGGQSANRQAISGKGRVGGLCW